MLKQPFGSDQTIIRYLLNDLSEEDQDRFEEAYLGDGSLFEQVRALEEELIEDYVKGNLSRRERRLFERHYLASDQRRARIAAARQLVQMCSSKAPTQTAPNDRIENNFFSLSSLLESLKERRPTLSLGVAAAILSLLGTGLVIGLLSIQNQSKMAPNVNSQAETPGTPSGGQLTGNSEEGAKPPDSPANLNNQSAQEGAGNRLPKNRIVLLALTQNTRSLYNPDRAVISPRTSFVKLRVDLETYGAASARSYRAVVKTVEGDREIWTQEGIKPLRRKSTQYVIVTVPAHRFRAARAQDFELALSALADGGKGYEEPYPFYFQVTAKRR